MRYIIKTICVVLVVAVLSVALLGCNGNNENGERDKKPSLHEAIAAYEAERQKKSVFEGEFKMTFFRNQGGETLPQTIAQKLVADRIQNQDQIYIDAKFGTSYVSEDLMSFITSIVNILNSNLFQGSEGVVINDDFREYLNGETEFRGLLGYNGLASYNGKADYIYKDEEPDYKDEFGNPYWASIDDLSIANLMDNFGIDGEISIKDYLMFSTMIDLNPSEEWVRRDEADNFFSEEEEAYMYAVTTYGSKLRNLILELMGEAEEKMDPDQYQEELELYAEIIPTVMSWISVPDSKVDAKVSKDGKLSSFSSSMRVDVNINFSELRNIMALLTDDDSSVKVALGLANYLMTSSTGENGIWTFRFELSTNETFYYDEESINIENKDQELFISNSEDVEGRYEIRIDLEEEGGEEETQD